jgi:tetratricopeptide (TPR) repeat protein
MALSNNFFRGCTLPITISCLISVASIPKQTAKAEESGRYHFITKEGQKDFPFNPDLELKKLNGFISQDKDNAEYYYNRGWLYRYLNNLKQAEKDYSRAIEIDKEHADAHYNRGLIFMETKRYDLAIRDFSEVIRIKPGATDAFCNRGNAYLAEGYTLSALKDFNAAIKLAPKDPDLYYNRALLYISEGKKSKGMEDMKEAAKLGHAQAREYIKKSGDKL